MKRILLSFLAVTALLTSCKEEDTENKQNMTFYFLGRETPQDQPMPFTNIYEIKIDTIKNIKVEIGRYRAFTVNSTRVFATDETTLSSDSYQMEQTYEFKKGEIRKKIEIHFDKSKILGKDSLILGIETNEEVLNPYIGAYNSFKIRLIPADAK